VSVNIRAKGITLTDDLKAHINSAVETFSKFSMEITSYNVNITKEKKGVAVEFDIHVAHAPSVVINQSDEDIDVAIDVAIERTSKALRRLHDKMNTHGNVSIKDFESDEV
jgi:ribosomal subunit interface protein